MNVHEKYMHRCLQLAKNGLGTTYPNPLVGAVIVYNDTIIGEGWHQKSGLPHAEVNAINKVKDKSKLKEATLYVNLEPCSHFGKTPPCANLIIDNAIKKVVIGTKDPNSKVAGSGIEKLEKYGIEVVCGVLEEECNQINKRFFCFHKKRRPYIILKWAQSQDGFIAPETKKNEGPFYISNSISRQLVHKWRTEEQAILVGYNTIIKDNPKLNAREWRGNQPIRIVLDKNNSLNNHHSIFDMLQPTIIFNNEENYAQELVIKKEKIIFDSNALHQIIEKLHYFEVQSILIEGGKKTLDLFIKEQLWDEARIFTNPMTLYNGIPSPEVEGKIKKQYYIENDQLTIIEPYD